MKIKILLHSELKRISAKWIYAHRNDTTPILHRPSGRIVEIWRDDMMNIYCAPSEADDGMYTELETLDF